MGGFRKLGVPFWGRDKDSSISGYVKMQFSECLM